MSEAEQVRRLANAIHADWRASNPGASNGAAALAGVGAIRIAHVALREMRAMEAAMTQEGAP